MIQGLKQEENDKDREQDEGIKKVSNGILNGGEKF